MCSFTCFEQQRQNLVLNQIELIEHIASFCAALTEQSVLSHFELVEVFCATYAEHDALRSMELTEHLQARSTEWDELSKIVLVHVF